MVWMESIVVYLHPSLESHCIVDSCYNDCAHITPYHIQKICWSTVTWLWLSLTIFLGLKPLYKLYSHLTQALQSYQYNTKWFSNVNKSLLYLTLELALSLSALAVGFVRHQHWRARWGYSWKATSQATPEDKLVAWLSAILKVLWLCPSRWVQAFGCHTRAIGSFANYFKSKWTFCCFSFVMLFISEQTNLLYLVMADKC